MKSMLGMILQVCDLFFQVKMLTGKVLGTSKTSCNLLFVLEIIT